MLARVAQSLYWMSRYLERAEHTARLLDVNLHQMLDQTPRAAERRWDQMLTSLRAPPPAEGTGDAYAVTRSLTFDEANGASIFSCVGMARDNARQVRERISSEMWEQINRLYLSVRGTTIDEIWQAEPHEFFRTVKEGAHLFQGITDGTMSHGQGWQFIQAGRYIERGGSTALLLDVHLTSYLEGSAGRDDLQWVGLLKSCTAFEAYCKVHTVRMQPERVAEFLLFDAEFPRSVRFVAGMVQASLQAISRATGARSPARAERLAGKLRAVLDYSQVDEILAEDVHGYLTNIQDLCTAIHTALHQTYILQQDVAGRRRWVEEQADPAGPGAAEAQQLTEQPMQQQQ